MMLGPGTYAAQIFSNYWMRLSRIWRIPQIKEDVNPRGRRPRWITPSEICKILHILQKPNYFLVLKGVWPFRSLFFRSPNIIQPCPQVFSVNGSINLQRAALLTSFWHHWFNNLQRAALLTSLVQYLVNSSCLWWIMPTCVVLTNLKTGKYFECWLVGCKRNVQNLISTFISSVVSQ